MIETFKGCCLTNAPRCQTTQYFGRFLEQVSLASPWLHDALQFASETHRERSLGLIVFTHFKHNDAGLGKKDKVSETKRNSGQREKKTFSRWQKYFCSLLSLPSHQQQHCWSDLHRASIFIFPSDIVILCNNRNNTHYSANVRNFLFCQELD